MQFIACDTPNRPALADARSSIESPLIVRWALALGGPIRAGSSTSWAYRRELHRKVHSRKSPSLIRASTCSAQRSSNNFQTTSVNSSKLAG